MTGGAWNWIALVLSGLAALVAAVVGFLFLRKKPPIEPLPGQAKAEGEFAKTVESAQREFDGTVAAIEAKREEAKVEVVRGLEEKSGPLLEDGDALTEHLKKVGEQTRNDP